MNLVYLDPPFKSDQYYHVLFAEQEGSRFATKVPPWARSKALETLSLTYDTEGT